ncbi:hypothetical protein [Compostimonas suwonensis]|uniref:Gram-positive cocci surface proteins LPxTG domain-containing protein n=1 Tax=Compostimonas suwonensis TaxID=1048394 RepID=A0A2M9C542_9MICO|nr:hypothetical protein [Compostimonas suwonensis]PJJ65651.1 hypothetical protein CLV54_0688 [Compostimonas suwonensis]
MRRTGLLAATAVLVASAFAVIPALPARAATTVVTTAASLVSTYAAARTGDVIVLGADLTSSAALVPRSSIDLTLDLNGKRLTVAPTSTGDRGAVAVPIEGSLTIRDSGTGGRLTATGSKGNAGIYVAIADLFIEGGQITATGGVGWFDGPFTRGGGAGIGRQGGGGAGGEHITITGGSVTATGGNSVDSAQGSAAAGIGGGGGGTATGNDVSISNATVVATGGSAPASGFAGAGIGGGGAGNGGNPAGGTVVIGAGANVTASASTGANPVGQGGNGPAADASSGDLTIEQGATLTIANASTALNVTPDALVKNRGRIVSRTASGGVKVIQNTGVFVNFNGLGADFGQISASTRYPVTFPGAPTADFTVTTPVAGVTFADLGVKLPVPVLAADVLLTSWGSGSTTVTRTSVLSQLVNGPGNAIGLTSRTSAVTVTGDAVPGGTLTAALSAVPGLGYQWLDAEGDPIVGATGQTFSPTAAQSGGVVSVRVTAPDPDSFYAAPRTAIASSRPIVPGFDTASVTVSGEPVVGRTLTADIDFSPEPDDVVYEWSAGGTTLGTGSSYVIQESDLGEELTVSATATKEGYATTIVESEPTEAVSAEFGSAPVVSIGGTPAVGGTLSAHIDSEAVPVPSGYDYAWFAGGEPIDGADDDELVLTAAQEHLTITVQVTPVKKGYVGGTGSSAATAAVAPGAFTSLPEVVVVGDLVVGGTLTIGIRSDAVPQPTSYRGLWLADGVPITGDAADSLTLTAAQEGAVITVAVAPVLAGYEGGGVVSPPTAAVGKGGFSQTPEISIVGDAVVGGTLTAHIDVDAVPAPSGHTVAWFADGAPLDASGDTLVLTAEELGARITAVVTPVLAGYAGGAGSSEPSAPVAVGSFSSTPAVSIAGDAVVGATLTAVIDSAAVPAPIGYTYQWSANGEAIDAAIGGTFVPTAQQLGAAIGVTATPVLGGYAGGSAASARTPAIAPGSFSSPADASITGTAAVGETLGVDIEQDSVPAPDGYHYQWLANGEPLDGKTKKTLLLAAAQRNAVITVRLTPVLDGYEGGTLTTEPTASVAAGSFGRTAEVSIAGDAAVGQTLSAHVDADAAPAPSGYTFQWFAGARLLGAGDDYTLAAADRGAAITVIATPVLDGYEGGASVSPATAAVGSGSFSVLPQAAVSGTAQVGRTLTATVSAHAVPAPQAYAFQWLADGEPVEGAVESTFVLGAAQLGASITVEITPLLDGYAGGAAASEATADVAVGAFGSSPTVAISGEPKVGTTLAAEITTDSVPAPSGYSYQWLVDGEPLLGADDGTFPVTAAQLGATIGVIATPVLAGYAGGSGETALTGEIAPGDFDAVAAASIVGAVVVGGTLTAVVDADASPVPAGYGYQWSADGAPLDGQTANSLHLIAELLGSTITVTLTPLLGGYAGGQTTTDATAAVGTGSFSSVPTVTIAGDAAVGTTLVAHADGAVPAPSGYIFQWFADGAAIDGATTESFLVTAAQQGAAVTVAATPVLVGYTGGSSTSSATAEIAAGSFARPATLSVSGDAAVGGTLTATVDTDAAPVPSGYAFQWFADGEPIEGATSASFGLVAAQEGAIVTVVATPVLDGYEGGAATSPATPAVAVGSFTGLPAVSITGGAAVGETLTVVVDGGSSPAAQSYDYRWFADGEPIEGARGGSFTLTAAQLGAIVTVTVIPLVDGYTSDGVASAGTEPIEVGAFTGALTVTVEGRAQLGGTLTAVVSGELVPAPGAVVYTWYAGGEVIEGQSGETLTLTEAQLGEPISVRVTATVDGYEAQTTGSPQTAPVADVPGAALSTGTVIVGRTVTVTGTRFLGSPRCTLELHSTPVTLATVAPDAEGSFSATVTVPADTAPGAHEIVVVAPDGTAVVSMPLTVEALAIPTATPVGADLANTGVEVSPLVLLGSLGALLLGAFLLLGAVRRRRA